MTNSTSEYWETVVDLKSRGFDYIGGIYSKNKSEAYITDVNVDDVSQYFVQNGILIEVKHIRVMSQQKLRLALLGYFNFIPHRFNNYGENVQCLELINKNMFLSGSTAPENFFAEMAIDEEYGSFIDQWVVPQRLSPLIIVKLPSSLKQCYAFERIVQTEIQEARMSDMRVV